MDELENDNGEVDNLGKPLIITNDQISIHPSIAKNENFQHYKREYRLDFTQNVIETLSELIVFTVVVKKSNKKIKDYYLISHLGEFIILEAKGIKTFKVAVLEVEPTEEKIIIGNLLQSLITKRDPVSTLFLAAKRRHVCKDMDARFIEIDDSDSRQEITDITGFKKRGAQKVAQSMVVTAEEEEFLGILNLKFGVQKTAIMNTETDDMDTQTID